MVSDIQIMEKPEWVSWEEIKQCLYEAHSVNRTKGIYMKKYLLPADKLCEHVGENGVMIVALDNNKVVGTAAVRERYSERWYTRGRYAHMVLASVLPRYSGKGIYKRINQKKEEVARNRGFSVFVTDTHIKNKRLIHLAKSSGYQNVGYYMVGKHYNVIMAKWTEGCPYSKFYCRFRLFLSWIKINIRCLLNNIIEHK